MSGLPLTLHPLIRVQIAPQLRNLHRPSSAYIKARSNIQHDQGCTLNGPTTIAVYSHIPPEGVGHIISSYVPKMECPYVRQLLFLHKWANTVLSQI